MLRGSAERNPRAPRRFGLFALRVRDSVLRILASFVSFRVFRGHFIRLSLLGSRSYEREGPRNARKRTKKESHFLRGTRRTWWFAIRIRTNKEIVRAQSLRSDTSYLYYILRNLYCNGMSIDRSHAHGAASCRFRDPAALTGRPGHPIDLLRLGHSPPVAQNHRAANGQ